jgi:hypothetical protein
MPWGPPISLIVVYLGLLKIAMTFEKLFPCSNWNTSGEFLLPGVMALVCPSWCDLTQGKMVPLCFQAFPVFLAHGKIDFLVGDFSVMPR